MIKKSYLNYLDKMFQWDNDILTKSLDNVEHSVRTHCQSKFVKQSHYFNIVQSSRENAEASEVKRQLAVLERTVQELCAKHGHTWTVFQPTQSMGFFSYLADCYARVGVDQRLEFISPVLVSLVQQNVDCKIYIRERANNILRILTNAPRGKLFLMPYNSGQHWILVVIDPWDDSVLYFNHLANKPGDDFKDLIKLALNDWKIMVGRGVRKRQNYETLIDTVRCHIQESYVECGYFVLAFMREITLTIDGLALLQTKDFYTDADMSSVRQEWATFVT
ncbi:hypothetical protein TIFTF001_030211 [Ficus carica]|uniref:Ubiquitin-like protease family profile domain-containing protein n=1 Tax=Ficus carica TaxID=3494 RepID=A0AA88DTE8_FICCA|nr:hypothetical protein TIFTF001_030211 [Ficus carica]